MPLKRLTSPVFSQNIGIYNMVGAARRAGKSRTALWNPLKKHNLSPKFRY
jgi:hypothetical protein